MTRYPECALLPVAVGMDTWATAACVAQGAGLRRRTFEHHPVDHPGLGGHHAPECGTSWRARCRRLSAAAARRSSPLSLRLRGADYAEEAGLSIEQFARRLDEGVVYGARLDGELCGLAAFVPAPLAKKRHKATLAGVYVVEAARGLGIGSALVGRVIGHASTSVDQLHALVVTTNLAARRLYARLGFRPYGIEPRALKVADEYFHQELLVLCFERLPQFRPPATPLEAIASRAD